MFGTEEKYGYAVDKDVISLEDRFMISTGKIWPLEPEGMPPNATRSPSDAIVSIYLIELLTFDESILIFLWEVLYIMRRGDCVVFSPPKTYSPL